MTVRLHCTHCAISVSVPDGISARKFRCPKCDRLLSDQALSESAKARAPGNHFLGEGGISRLMDLLAKHLLRDKANEPAARRMLMTMLTSSVLLLLGSTVVGVTLFIIFHEKSVTKQQPDRDQFLQDVKNAAAKRNKLASGNRASEVLPGTPSLAEAPGPNAGENVPEKPTEIVSVVPGSREERIYPRLVKSTAFLADDKSGRGTGCLIDADQRLLLTTGAVVGGAARLQVIFPAFQNGKLMQDESFYAPLIRPRASAEHLCEGTVLAKEPRGDLVLIQLNRIPLGMQPIRFAAQLPVAGAKVFSIGNPGTGSHWVLSQSTIRGTQQLKTRAGVADSKVGETETALNAEDSGAPVVSDRCLLVGMTLTNPKSEPKRNCFIAIDEIESFLNQYAREKKIVWKPNHDPEEGFDQLTAAERIQQLDDADPAVRQKAIAALKDLGPTADAAWPGLLKALKDRDDAIRQLAADVLDRMPLTEKMVGPLIPALEDESSAVRIYAAAALLKLGPKAKSAAPALTRALKDPEVKVRKYAVQALGTMDHEGERIFPLLDALQDTDPSVSQTAEYILDHTKTIRAEDIPELITRAKNGPPPVRRLAVKFLSLQGEQSKSALPVLFEHLMGDDVDVRRRAAQAIHAIGPEPSQAPLLIQRLADADEVIVNQVVMTLNRWERLEASNNAALVDVLKSAKLKGGRIAALEYLGRLATPDTAAISTVVLLLKDEDVDVRTKTIAFLGKMGPAAVEHRAALMTVMQDADPEVRRSAVQALGTLGPKAWDVVPALARCLKDKDAKLRLAAIASLQSFGTDAKPAAPGLIELLGDKTCQESSRTVLLKIGKRGVPALLEALESRKDFTIRLQVVGILKELGPEAREAVPSLTKLAKQDMSAKMREEASAALRTIQRNE